MQQDWVEKAFQQTINQRTNIFMFSEDSSSLVSETKPTHKPASLSFMNRISPQQATRLIDVRFPEIQFMDNSDEYYEKLWSVIDGAEKHIWVMMYHFDDTSVGSITLYKLIEAAKRGVKVCTMHDTLTCSLHRGLMLTLQENDGIVHRLNEMYRIWKMPGRNYFKRDHEKLVIADGKVLLGSANISEDYAHRKHGNSFFYDFNMVGNNICLDQCREFILKVADWHGVNLDKNLTNHQAMEEYAKAFPDSKFTPKHWEIKAALQPYERDIQLVCQV